MKELHLGWFATATVLTDVLEAITGAPLELLSAEVTPNDVPLLYDWACATKPPFEVRGTLRNTRLRASVAIRGEGLVLIAPPDSRDEATRSIWADWPVGRDRPLLTHS